MRELRNVIERTCLRAKNRVISKADLLIANDMMHSKPEKEKLTLAEAEREQLVGALSRHEFNVANTAHSLGIATSTLYYKLRKHGIGLRRK